MMKSVLMEKGTYKSIAALRGERADAPCNNNKIYHVAMHEALVVPVCAWQMVQEKPFMWENYSKGGTLLRAMLLSPVC